MRWTRRGDTRDTWYENLGDRQLAEVEFARIYAKQFEHGTDGHNRLLLIAKLAFLLDKYQSALRMASAVESDELNRELRDTPESGFYA